MAEDVDKMLAEALERLREGVRKCDESVRLGYGAHDSPAGVRDVLAIARVLDATRDELAELKAIVGGIEPTPDVWRMLDAAISRDPCPVAGQHECRWQLGVRACVGDVPRLKHGPGGTGEAGPCDPDCAKCALERGDPVPGCCGNVGCPGCAWEGNE